MRPKPLSVKVIAMLIAVLAMVGAIWAFVAGAYAQALFSLIAFVGAIALTSWHPMSRFIVYAASAAISLAWLFALLQVAVAGWPSETLLHSVISLIPGLLLLTVCFGCSIYVARHFRHQP